MKLILNNFKNRIVVFCFFIFTQVIFSQNYSEFVNPFIGTGGHGHTFPGAVLPFGMVQLSPDTRVDDSWDGCSGYHYSDSIICGFSHTHLSGTGCSDWGDILLMPGYDFPNLNNKNYSSTFSHKNEKASAGFYKVLLTNGVNVELTTTYRTGIHKYTFLKNKKPQVILDLLHRDETLDQNIRLIDSNTVVGYRISKAWAKEQIIFYAIQFSSNIKRFDYAINKQFTKILNAKQKPQGALFEFNDLNGKPLLVKVGISSVSEEGALTNLKTEAPHWDFEKYVLNSKNIWDKELSKIEINDNDKNKLTIFYTALYHCFIHPSIASDIDGKYRGRDNKIYEAKNYTHYSVFSLWDTYRALHPLLTIIDTKRTADFINTFISQYQQIGRFPMWELSSNETDCMIGFHSVAVIADAMNKGITGFDYQKAFEGSIASSNYEKFGIPTFNKKYFLEVDDESESVSKSLEYAYDNWCIYKMSEILKTENNYKDYYNRSLSFYNLFHPSSKFMQPRFNGGWLKPFYPNQINNHYTEGNSWQYSFYVPQHLNKLIELHGGELQFEKKLDELFTTKQKTIGREQADVTGLIGQYAHGNEPSHHMAYLYNYVNKPYKTINYIHKICNEFYKNSPDGLIGNEDCGQMSAWYIFSSMGFYPVCPGETNYQIAAPYFNTIKINLENGNHFLIENNTSKNNLVSSVLVNGITLNNFNLNHSDIINGGNIKFNFNKTESTLNSYIKQPNLEINSSNKLLFAPIIQSNDKVFTSKQTVTISAINSKLKQVIKYTTNGLEPNKNSIVYTKPIKVEATTIIKAKVFSENDSSLSTTAQFYKLPNNYKIKISGDVNSQYAAMGDQTLIDGLYGSTDWRKGDWLGYQGQDIEILIDLNTPKDVHTISLNFLQDSRSWIISPKQVEYLFSNDKKQFTSLTSLQSKTNPKNENVTTELFTYTPETKIKFRFLKIKITHYGKLPEWHIGKNNNSFIFIDEIKIN